MSWPDRRQVLKHVARASAVVMVAGLTAGCFRPLYGDHSYTLGGGQPVVDALKSVSVKQIPAPSGTDEARLAVAIRNQLLFDLTGGNESVSSRYELAMVMHTDVHSVIVDPMSQRPNVENFGLDVRYSLKDINTGKTVLNATTFARVSYDAPGSEQRFASMRGLRDAETRAAKEIADNIRNRLASYFVAGT